MSFRPVYRVRDSRAADKKTVFITLPRDSTLNNDGTVAGLASLPPGGLLGQGTTLATSVSAPGSSTGSPNYFNDQLASGVITDSVQMTVGFTRFPAAVASRAAKESFQPRLLPSKYFD